MGARVCIRCTSAERCSARWCSVVLRLAAESTLARCARAVDAQAADSYSCWVCGVVEGVDALSLSLSGTWH